MKNRNDLAENLEMIEGRIARAAERCGRNPEEIRIMAVTKTLAPERVEEAYQAGIRLFGENRVQEALDKYRQFHDDAEIHMIGHLQSNKAKESAGFFPCVQSVDRIKIAQLLDKYSAEKNKHTEIFLEYNTSGEESKSGFLTEHDYFDAIEAIIDLEHVTIRGLMTIGPLTGDSHEIRKAFRFLKNLYDLTKSRYPEIPLDTLSMGMSGDFEIAVEEGSTLVRIGTLLFGQR